MPQSRCQVGLYANPKDLTGKKTVSEVSLVGFSLHFEDRRSPTSGDSLRLPDVMIQAIAALPT